MKNNRYKLLILSDLKEGTINTLKSAISLAKMIGADIDFFHVKKPIEVVETFSQLSAMRSINKEHIVTEKKIKDLLSSTTKDIDLKVKTSFSLGNVKNEIENKINNSKPDIIVLGKRKYNSLKFIGDNITDFVLSIHKGPVLMVSDNCNIKSDQELTLGLYNRKDDTLDFMFADDLLENTKQPIRVYNIMETSDYNDATSNKINSQSIDYVFEKNDNALNTLSSYLDKSNVNLFCVNRHEIDNKEKTVKSEIRNVVKKVNVSVLLTK